MILEKQTTLLFIGDSITDTGRIRPVGEAEGLGDGYVSIVDGLFAAHYPELNIRVLNTGISGNRVTDLQMRWNEDVMDLEPDWLTIKIGINDVWRHFDSPNMPGQVGIDRFVSTYDDLIARTLPTLKGLILLTPYLIEPRRDDPMRIMMDTYRSEVTALATKHGALLGDTQMAFDAYLEHNPAYTLCDDSVHPNRKGHTIIASCFLNTIGFEWKLSRGATESAE